MEIKKRIKKIIYYNYRIRRKKHNLKILKKLLKFKLVVFWT